MFHRINILSYVVILLDDNCKSSFLSNLNPAKYKIIQNIIGIKFNTIIHVIYLTILISTPFEDIFLYPVVLYNINGNITEVR